MKIKDKIIRILLITVLASLLIAVGILATDRYREIKEDHRKAVNEYQRLQYYIIQYLENAEEYILLYPLREKDDPNQIRNVAQAEIIKNQIDETVEMLGELTEEEFSYGETRLIKQIADEMHIYMQYLGTEKYPENAINFGYMNNLFGLMVKYRQILEQELDAFRQIEAKDLFDSEVYVKYQKMKQALGEKNTWELSPVIKGNEDRPELGPKLPAIDAIPTRIHSEEEGIVFAQAYFEEANGEISLDEIKIDGGGERNIHGRIFSTYEYRYKNMQVELYETGDIERVRFDDKVLDDTDESSVPKVTEDHIAEAEKIAQDYLKKHKLNAYGLSYKKGNAGRIYLIYAASPYPDYYDDLNTIEFYFVLREKILIESISYPRKLEGIVIDRRRFNEGYNKKEHLMQEIQLQYPIINAFYQNSRLDENIQTYEWRFVVDKDKERYNIIVDADTEEITGAYPFSGEWLMRLE